MINLTNIKILKRKIIKFIIYILIIIFILFTILELVSEFWILDLIKPYLDKIYTILTYSISISENIKISILWLISFSFIIFVWINLAKIYKKFIYWIKRKRKNLSHGNLL